ncbi:MAG: hypothetical protein ACWA5R_08465 [bacterium]
METLIRAVLLLLLFGCFEASAQIYDLDVLQVLPSDNYIQLLPGEQVDVTWQLRNNEDFQIGNFDLLIESTESTSGGSKYLFESLTPDVCTDPEQSPGIGFVSYHLDVVADIPAHTLALCTFRIHRSLVSTYDVDLEFGQACGFGICQGDHTFLGYLPDFSVTFSSQSPVFYGDTESLVRVTIDNPTPFEVNMGVAGCLDTTPLPFSMSVPQGVADACTVGFPDGLLCFDGGIGLVFGVVAANTEESCLLQLDFDEPITSQVGFPMELVFGITNIHVFVDPNSDNNRIYLGAAITPFAVPLSKISLMLMAFLLIVLTYFKTPEGLMKS